MFNVGLGFLAFGVMLLAMDFVLKLLARKRLMTTATIIGYKQFPSDKTITSNDIYRGQYFTWLRVMEFTDTRSGKVLQMYSNPGVQNPEPIGTTLTIAFDPSKTDPQKDYVLIRGGTAAMKYVGLLSLVVGLALFVILQLVPASSPIHFAGAVVGFAIVFVVGYIRVWHRPNQ
jgi:hypothetical protein